MAKVVRTSGLKLYYPAMDTLVIDETKTNDTMSDTDTMVKPEIQENGFTSECKDPEVEKVKEKAKDVKNMPENTTENTTENTPKVEAKKDSLNKILFDLVLNKKSSKIITGVCSFSVLLFVVAYFVSLHNAGSIKTHYEKRRDNMQAMIDINIGKYQDKYLIDIHPFLQESRNIFLGKSESVSLGDLGGYINDYRNNQLEYLQNQFKVDKNFTINQYVEVESSKINNQILEIEKNIALLDDKNKLFEENYNTFKIALEGLKNLPLNNVVDKSFIKNISVYTKIEATEGVNFIDFLISFDDNLQSYNEFGESNSGFNVSNYNKESLANLSKYTGGIEKQYYELLHSMYTNAQNIILNDETLINEKSENLLKKSFLIKEIESLKKSKVSIEKYKQNKTYLFQKQFDINDDTIHYTIDKAISYMALYHALLIVILFYTAVMVICSLAVGVKGWVGTDPNIKLLAMATVVILVMSNLILVTLRPRENYVNYIANAEINEAKQAKLIMFLNNYDKVNSVELDEFVNKNLDALTKFSEILPSTDESKLAKDVSKFTGSLN